MKTTNNKIFFIIFSIVWIAIILLNLATPYKAFSENENRYLAKFPAFSFKSFVDGDYMRGIEEYNNDQFIYRDQWISVKTILERALLKQESNSVYFAKDDYLIEKHKDSDISKQLSDKNIGYLEEFMQTYGLKLGDKRVKAMFVPTASEVLSSKLPLFATGFNQKLFVENFKAKIPDEHIIDVSDVLMEHQDEYIYYRTDHHWTALGAYYAYEQWALSLDLVPLTKDQFEITLASDQFYGTLHSKVNTIVNPDNIYLYHTKEEMNYELTYNLENKSNSLYDLSRLNGKDKYSVYMGGNNASVEIQTKLDNGKRLLVIKDSFANSFVPFAVNHYEKTIMIDLRYYNTSLESFINENKITDILVLYNVVGFAKDTNLLKLLQ